MLIRFANLETALLVLIAVLALLFFPAPRGSFVSTHGPVTSIQGLSDSLLCRITLAFASLGGLYLALFANTTSSSAATSISEAARRARMGGVLRI